MTEANRPVVYSRRVIIGTRGSRLALWQAGWVRDRLQEVAPGLAVETRIFTTQGDRIQDRPLQGLSDEGFFVRELEEALLRREIDLAVHSLKDLPHEQPAGLTVACVPGRADARDALISRQGRTLADLPQGATVGTSSTRRASQLLAGRPDLRLLPLRGNVDTRLRKLYEGETYDAIILACAGLDRLGRSGEITERLSFDRMLPAPGQGALGPECRADDIFMLDLLARLNDPAAQAAVTCEKDFMAGLGGGCLTPVGCYAEVDGAELVARGYVGRPDGLSSIRLRRAQLWDGRLEAAVALGRQLAEQALAEGGGQMLDQARAEGYVTGRK